MGNKSSTYKGDSPGKKVARARLWINAGMVMTALDTKYRGAYVLAGEGGDVSTLKALSFPPNTITAVDTDKDYASFVGELYPGIQTLAGEAGNWSEVADYNAANLDFCNGLTLENIETAYKVAKNASSYPMCLGVTLMKGREALSKPNYGVNPDLPRAMRKELRRRSLKFGEQSGDQLLMRGKRFDPALCIERSTKRLMDTWAVTGFAEAIGAARNGKLTPLGHGMVRMDAFRGCLDLMLYEHGLQSQIVSCLSYHSKSKHSGGTGFVCGNYVIVPMQEREMLQAYLTIHAPSLMMFDNIPGGESRNALRKFALSGCKGLPSKVVAELFDIPPGTVAAWRANNTRGRYVNDEPNTVGSLALRRGGLLVDGHSNIPGLGRVNIGEEGAPISPMYSGWGSIVYTPEWELRMVRPEEDTNDVENKEVGNACNNEITRKTG